MILLDLFRFLPAMMAAATITAETNKYDKSLLIPNKTERAFRSQSLSSRINSCQVAGRHEPSMRTR